MKSAPRRLTHGTGQILTLEPSRIVVVFKEEQSSKEVEAFLGRFGLILEDADDEPEPERRGFREIVNHSRTRFWARSKEGEAVYEKIVASVQDPRRAPWSKVDWIGPVYRSPQLPGRLGLLCVAPHALLIKPAGQAEQLRKALPRYGLEENTEKSKYLNDYWYFVATEPLKKSAFEIRDEISEKEKQRLRDIRWETIPMIVPTALVPTDTHFSLQWNMAQTKAGGLGTTGWNISTGSSAVTICILDSGCDLGHPDLNFATPGINLGTMMPDGSPTGSHGTACAGIAAAAINNGAGVAGMAGNCRVMPLAFSAWSDVEVAAGINYAAANGARVISMSFGWNAWDPAIINPAISNAFGLNVVMCAATHNYNGPITYPATNPLVMACGASDQVDNRKSPSSPDLECWGSDFGAQMSVVAPGVRIPTSDIQGNGGYNNNNGGPKNVACVNYPSTGDSAGNYFFVFDGTSAATPHVAGLAALLISYNTSLTNVQVRNIIEQTADKVGSAPYATVPGYPNGTWNNQMGYGRINVYQALRSISKLIFKDVKELTDTFHFHKPRFADLFWKANLWKEKEGIDEVKGLVGYENPEIFDPGIFEKILTRLDRLEREVLQGRAFIQQQERPEVGKTVAAQPRKKKAG